MFSEISTVALLPRQARGTLETTKHLLQVTAIPSTHLCKFKEFEQILERQFQFSGFRIETLGFAGTDTFQNSHMKAED